MLRRDRNCPSVIIWSYGNEVGEQYTGEKGAELGKQLCDIIKDEEIYNLVKPENNKFISFSFC